jgi:hypothetical protein
MGFHKRHIPDLKTLKDIYSGCVSEEEFFDIVVGKAEAVSGPPESISFLDEIYEKMKLKNEELQKN